MNYPSVVLQSINPAKTFRVFLHQVSHIERRSDDYFLIFMSHGSHIAVSASEYTKFCAAFGIKPNEQGI